jgi:hypothetical protein
MAIDIDWRIKYYTNTTTTVDLTSYAQSTSINIEVAIGLAGRSTATIVLNNNTGAFTPNGTGTFASVDWFRYAFVIENKSNSSGYITSFCGMVSDVNIEVISIKESRFTLTLVDILTIAGRSSATTTYAGTIVTSFASQGIDLKFIQMGDVELENPYASILDLLFTYDKEHLKQQLTKYTLI